MEQIELRFEQFNGRNFVYKSSDIFLIQIGINKKSYETFFVSNPCMEIYTKISSLQRAIHFYNSIKRESSGFKKRLVVNDKVILRSIYK